MLTNRGPPPAKKNKKCVCLPKDSALASKQRIQSASRIQESRNISGGQYELAIANEKKFQAQYSRYTPAQYKGFGEVMYVSKIMDPKTFTAHSIRQQQRTRLSQQKRVGAIECASCVPDLAQEKLDYEYGKVFGPDARKTLAKEIRTYEKYTYASPPAVKGPVRVKLLAVPALEAPKKVVKKGKKPQPTYLELVKDGPDIAAYERIAAQEREDRLAKEALELEARKAAARELLEKRVALEAAKVAAQSEAAKLKAAEDAAIKKMELAERRAARLAREATDAAMREKIQKEQKERSVMERRKIKAERLAEDARVDNERIEMKAKKQAQLEADELAIAAKNEAASKFLEYRRRAEQEWLETQARLAEDEKVYERQRRDAREKREAKERAEAQAEAQAEAARREAEAARIAARKWEEEREEREKREAEEAIIAREAARLKAIQDKIDQEIAEKLAKETAEREAKEKEAKDKAEREARRAAAKAAEEAAKIEEQRKKEEAEKKKKEEADKAKAEKAAKAAEAKAKMLAEREAAKAAKAAKGK